MQRYEFKVIPAPRRGEKLRGLKTTEDRFALALTNVMNEQGREGWDYVRADTLPVDERVGFTGIKTSFHNMLVFRRIIEADAAEPVQPATPPRMITADPVVPVGPRLGPAEPPVGTAPQIGPAMAAE